MTGRFHHASRTTKFILAGEFLLLSYLLYALTSYIYKNAQVDYHVQNFQETNAQLERENRKAAEDLMYYTSNAYIEKIAKQNLDLVNPGEQVIVISDELMQQPVSDTASSIQQDVISKYYGLPNPLKWWKFFFEIDHRVR